MMTALQTWLKKEGRGRELGSSCFSKKKDCWSAMPSRNFNSHWVPTGSNTCLTQKCIRPSYLHKEVLPMACFQNRAQCEQPGAAAYSWQGTTLCMRQAFLQSSDSETLEARSMVSLTDKCLSSPFSKAIFWHGTVLLEKVRLPDFLIPLSSTDSK